MIGKFAYYGDGVEFTNPWDSDAESDHPMPDFKEILEEFVAKALQKSGKTPDDYNLSALAEELLPKYLEKHEKRWYPQKAFSPKLEDILDDIEGFVG